MESRLNGERCDEEIQAPSLPVHTSVSPTLLDEKNRSSFVMANPQSG
jgi:hypothetical protein